MTDIRAILQDLAPLLRRDSSPSERAELAPLIHDARLALAAFAGDEYEYGIPGSDPNVEQLPDGRLRITLLQPLVSGQETIEVVIMSPSTVADAMAAQDVLKSAGSNDVRALLAKFAKQTRTESGRLLTRTELEGLLEEEAMTLKGASDFLVERFRRTRRSFRTG